MDLHIASFPALPPLTGLKLSPAAHRTSHVRLSIVRVAVENLNLNTPEGTK